MCPFSILAFFQPTTVDKEPEFRLITIKKKYLDYKLDKEFLLFN